MALQTTSHFSDLWARLSTLGVVRFGLNHPINGFIAWYTSYLSNLHAWCMFVYLTCLWEEMGLLSRETGHSTLLLTHYDNYEFYGNDVYGMFSQKLWERTLLSLWSRHNSNVSLIILIFLKIMICLLGDQVTAALIICFPIL